MNPLLCRPVPIYTRHVRSTSTYTYEYHTSPCHSVRTVLESPFSMRIFVLVCWNFSASFVFNFCNCFTWRSTRVHNYRSAALWLAKKCCLYFLAQTEIYFVDYSDYVQPQRRVGNRPSNVQVSVSRRSYVFSHQEGCAWLLCCKTQWQSCPCTRYEGI
jgi:hypothetical protein